MTQNKIRVIVSDPSHYCLRFGKNRIHCLTGLFVRLFIIIFYVPGNFTQLVWNSSKKLGVGIALSTSNILYVVCKYDPPGNVDNAYKYNVFERIKDNNSKCESILESDQFPYFRHAKGNSGSTNTRIMKDAASSIETVEKNYSQIRSPNHYDGEIEWWSIFDNIMGALASELHLLLLGSHDHSVEKRDLAHLDIEDFEETIRNELKSLSRMTNTDTDTLSGEKNDNTVLSAAKTYCQCCCEEETDPSKDPCNCSGSAHNKCDCQRLTTLEILSRKIDMVLVFTVFNNIFMIIFGVAVTLGVVVQWCTGPGMNKRRR